MAVALPFIMMGLTAVSTVMQMQGAKSDAKAQAQAQEFNAQVADRNAGIARQQAAQDADLQQRQARKQIGAARAAYGASGVTLEGSPLDVLEQSASDAERDRQTIIYKGELRAMGYTDEANLDRFGGQTALDRGDRQASAILLGGAAKVAGQAYGVAGNTGRNIPVNRVSAGADDWSY